MKNLFLAFSLLFGSQIMAQDWTFTALADMPEPVSNNSVVAAEVMGKEYVYSFAGIDSTKVYTGIHNKCWRYDVSANIWESLPDLPDPLGKIALGVNVIDGIAYIMGGYHVFENGSELTSEKVHRFDLATNTFLADGAPIPVPVDDHVQAVYKDSLIYLVTGWSGTQSSGGNVRDVQIYNPTTDTWQEGTPVFASSNSRVFGTSGVIIGNKIYYFGGAKIVGNNFNSSQDFRIGTIDENDPTQITWEVFFAGFPGYRTAATEIDGNAYFLGGSDVTYNYNGIAYNGSGGVGPNQSSLAYDPVLDTVFRRGPFPEMPMDLRSLGELSDNKRIIAGGMESGQIVSNKTWLLDFNPIDYVQTNEVKTVELISLFPNPTTAQISFNIDTNQADEIRILDLEGKVQLQSMFSQNTISLSTLAAGMYIVQFFQKGQIVGTGKFIKS